MATEKIKTKSLVVNTGSDSHKYALYEEKKEIITVHLETEADGHVANIKIGEIFEKRKVVYSQYEEPVKFFLTILDEKKIISDLKEIDRVGFRVVAPGEYFISHNLIDDDYFSKLKEIETEAPLHITPVISEIEQVKGLISGARLFGISDSEFHKDLPEIVRRYAIPEADAVGFGIYRYGYHGISNSSIMRKLGAQFVKMPERVIVCHLGSGSSITAIKDGKSFDTSMGFTPLEGLLMGSRAGNIDAAAVLTLGQKKNFNYPNLQKYLNVECGFLALSGKTKDVRELIELEHNGDAKAKLALDSFAYQVRKYIGSYVAALGGLDLLIFTATIGERSNIMRERICNGLERLGIALDKSKNEMTIDREGLIQSDIGSIQIMVMKTDEAGQIVTEINKIA